MFLDSFPLYHENYDDDDVARKIDGKNDDDDGFVNGADGNHDDDDDEDGVASAAA